MTVISSTCSTDSSNADSGTFDCTQAAENYVNILLFRILSCRNIGDSNSGGRHVEGFHVLCNQCD